MLCLWVQMRDVNSCDPGGGGGYRMAIIAAGGIPNSFYRVLFFYLFLARACVIVRFFLSFLLLFHALVGAVDVSLIYSCSADHVPDWQPRVLLGMVEARSVNVKNTHTHTQVDVKNPARGHKVQRHHPEGKRTYPHEHACFGLYPLLGPSEGLDAFKILFKIF